METIKEKIEKSVQGNEEAKNFLKERYAYIIDIYYNKYKDKISRKELKIMYDLFFEDYYKKEQKIPVALYIHKSFTNVLYEKFDKKDILVKETIILACKGDFEARNKLINHFLPLVYKFAKKYDYMEHDDLVQNGTIKLIETIDNLIVTHPNGYFLTNTIPRAIEIYFNKTLRKQFLNLQTEDYLLEDKTSAKILEIEVEDFIDNYPASIRDKSMLKNYMIGNNTMDQIAAEIGVSKELVRLTLEDARKKLKKVR